ncbi:MAG TPA: hypothetical protein VFK89_11160 [Actinomycetota bacterium]|nr:hypothetical protein [Actinomycetota bacterium]
MRKFIYIVLATGLVASIVGSPGVATAAKETKIVTDPSGDSNGINDQGTGDGSFGDFTQAGVGNVSDLSEVRISNDAKNLYITFQAQGVPPASEGLGYRLRFNPTATPGTQCLLFEAFWPGGGNNLEEAHAHIWDQCNGADPIEVKIVGPMLTVPRKASKLLGKGAVLKAPQAQSFVWSGTYPTGVAGPYLDTTKVGKDYKLVD